MFSKFFRDRIDAAMMPGVAFQEPPYCKVCSAHRAKALDGVYGIIRACREESAMVTDPRAEQVLVESDQGDEESLHRRVNLSQCFSRARRSTAEFTAVAGVRAMTT